MTKVRKFSKVPKDKIPQLLKDLESELGKLLPRTTERADGTCDVEVVAERDLKPASEGPDQKSSTASQYPYPD